MDLPQITRLFVGLVWMSWSLTWYFLQGTSSYAALLATAALAVGLVLTAVAARPHTPEFWRRFDRAGFVLALLLIAVWLAASSTTQVYNDELAVGQISATTIIHGANPYTADMTSALHSFGVPPFVSTPTLDGRILASASYPALSFLSYVPLGLLLGTGAPYALLTDGLFYIAFLLLLWKLAPRSVRPFLPIVALSPLFASYVSTGTTDVVYLPFLLIALYRWDRYGLSAEHTAARWVGPLALGLACAVKPTPWLVAPFLVLGIGIEAQRRGGRDRLRLPLRYLVAASSAFVAVNLPFILMGPASWFRGSFLPVVNPLVPLGSGAVNLAVSLGVGGGDLRWLTLAGICGMACAISSFAGWHRHAKLMVPVLAVLPLFVASRSLMNYFVYAPILLIVSVGTNRDGSAWPFGIRGSMVRRGFRSIAVCGGVAGAVCTLAFLASPAPLQLRLVREIRSVDGSGRVTVSIVVSATNRTDQRIRPYITVGTGNATNVSYRAVTGPAELAPHAQGTYLIESDNVSYMLGGGSHYFIQAYSSSPPSISSSPEYTATG